MREARWDRVSGSNAREMNAASSNLRSLRTRECT